MWIEIPVERGTLGSAATWKSVRCGTVKNLGSIGLLFAADMAANLQGFGVTDPLDFQIPERLDEVITELIGAGRSARRPGS